VATLLNEHRNAGRHDVTWQGRDDSGRQVASGTYFYRLQVGNHVESKRMTLLK
jgi:flagellar hook assembly protein FlgD